MATDYKTIFEMFCGQDELRLDFMTPFKQGDNYYATDGHALICVPCSIVKLDYKEQETPNCKAVMPTDHTCSLPIPVKELRAKLTPVMVDEMKSKMEKCNECGGDGEVEYEYWTSKKTYTMDADCPICEGEGSVGKDKPTGNKIPDPEAMYQIDGVLFGYEYLDRLIKVCELLDVDAAVKVAGAENKGNLFLCSDVKVLIMPRVLIEKDAQFKVIELSYELADV